MVHKILIVDDSSVIRTVCRLVLQRAGYEVVEAWDASQAASRLKEMEIAFVLCDLNIPGKNGVELIEEMRKMAKFAELPTAIMSVVTDAELVERAKRAGVKGWLFKPCPDELLLQLVAKHVGPP